MLDSLPLLPCDPILGLMSQFKQDTRADKIDLGVGVFRDDKGHTPVLDCVKQAERSLLKKEKSKAYIGPQGNASFNILIQKLVLGNALSAQLNSRTVVMQTPGGCGALRVAAELMIKAQKAGRSKSPVIWVSDPTWGNHVPLLGDAGIEIKTYPYYDFKNHSVRFDDMMSFLSDRANPNDYVLLHACCHNPSGADFTQKQWYEIAKLCQKRQLIPFVDMAYQGFGHGLDDDSFGLRLLAEKLPQILFAYSCSKNFGLYRERVGAVGAILSSGDAAKAVSSQLQSIVRGIYSMPPSHGAAVVETILSSLTLETLWHTELDAMRIRISAMRESLVYALKDKGFENDYAFIATEKGMFSFLGLSPEHVKGLAKLHGIYMVPSSRINVAGLSEKNLPKFVDALYTTLRA